jgi:hypothetical protein
MVLLDEAAETESVPDPSPSYDFANSSSLIQKQTESHRFYLYE